MRKLFIQMALPLAILLCAAFVLVMINQTVQVVALADRIHPTLGTTLLWTLLALYAIGYLMLNYTKLGAYTFALGDNEEGARLAGIPINRYKTILYIMSGVCMGMAAIIIISRIALVASNLAGVSLLLDAVASVILGGTSINGGSGTVEGTLIGVVLVGMISNALNLLNVPPVFQDVFKGGVIILALYYQVLTKPARAVWKR